MSFLVTGATGQVGRHVVKELVDAGAQVRAITRTPDRSRFPAGVQALAGDLAQPASLDTALTGVERLYLFPNPETAARVVDLAVRKGIKRIVVLSSSSAADETNHSGAYHLAVERAVQAADVEWTFVRPDEFATNILWKWGHSIRAEGVVRTPYAQAAKALIHEADVAAVAAAALLTDDHVGETYELTGPEALTQVEQVRLIGQAIGREIRFEEITAERGKAELCRFMPEPVVDMVLAYLASAVDNPTPVLPTVEKVLCRPGLSFAQWAADHAADFRPAA